MIQNYIKIAIRALWNSKIHSLINVFGLGLGICCCLLITLYVHDEWTFDTFHRKSGRIYRAWARENYGEGKVMFNTMTPIVLGSSLKQNFQEVEASTFVATMNPHIKVGDHQFSEQITAAGSQFFNIFDFDVYRGALDGAMDSKDGLVITRKIATKYFGTEDAINKVISVELGEGFVDFTIKAVLENLPGNSSIQFDILMSDTNLKHVYPENIFTTWFNIIGENYILLREGTRTADLEKKFPSMLKTALGDDYNSSHYEAGLQPITDIHLNVNFPAGNAPVGNPRLTYILAAIAGLILVVACINFVTLSIGRSMRRAREVGIRKVVGASRLQLMFQFLSEAILITLFALLIGVVLALLNTPLFNELSGKSLSLQLNQVTLFVTISLVIIIGLVAGSYPAFILSGFKPISILKGKLGTGDDKQMVRKLLVGFQVILSIFLISSTLIMNQQLKFIQNNNIGYQKEQMVVIPIHVPRNNGGLVERVTAGFDKVSQFESELVRIPGVAAVAGSSHDFGNGNWTQLGYTDDNGVYRNFNLNVVDAQYIPTLKMQMAVGRNFSANNPGDKARSILVNEALVKQYGWKDAIGKRLPGKGFKDHEIIGVVRDFNFESLYTAVKPLVLVMDAGIVFGGVENIMIQSSPIPKLMVRLNPDNMNQTIEQLKATYHKIAADEFSFSFVDQKLNAQYIADQNLGKMVSIATVISILIGSLGLYALASLAMQNRIKEISIRKVMGASEKSLLILLSREYLYLIAICFCLSIPLTWYLMDKWLYSFEYKIDIQWYVFLWAGSISLLIAILTISYQTISTSRTQPAQTLKNE